VSPRRLFPNLCPEDVSRECRRFSLVEENGKWYTVNASGTRRFSACGTYPFVVTQEGCLFVTNRRYGHIDIDQGRDVLFAGEIRFSGRTTRGRLCWWSNGSGHYRPPGEYAHQAGLPLELFWDH